MNKVKYIIYFLFILSIIGFFVLSKKYVKLHNDYLTSIENIKAYDTELSGLKDNNRVFKLTIDLLNYFNDSIIKKLKVALKELGIKDKRLLELQYEKSIASKSDTINLIDTVFVDNFKLDTIIGDKWFRNRIVLSYPNTISSSVTFNLERLCFVLLKKETVNPPKKFFLARWFQKKHYVTIVTIKENNPYVEIKDSRYIQIIK